MRAASLMSYTVEKENILTIRRDVKKTTDAKFQRLNPSHQTPNMRSKVNEPDKDDHHQEGK